MSRNCIAILLALYLAGCAGEVTTIDFGDAEAIARDRFTEEIFPILHSTDSGLTSAGDETYQRNCTTSNCHGERPIGGLLVRPEINEANALETFRMALDEEQLILGDADASSFLQHTFRSDGHTATCYPSRTDCCFLKVEAWINAVDPPACDDCPIEEPD